MLALAVLTGNGPGYYLMGGFYRRSISWTDKRDHLGQAAYRRRVLRINPIEYQKISQNKLAEKGLLSLLGFPTPRFLGFMHPQTGRTCDGARLRDCAELAAFLDTVPSDEICFKLVEGWSGMGFVAVRRTEMQGVRRIVLLNTGEVVSPEILHAVLLQNEGGHGRLIEELLQQHEAVARFNPSSVNTCRLWVVRPTELSRPECVLAFLRVGRSSSLVDNVSAGGLSIPVDLKTGTTGPAVAGGADRQYFPVHPDHGAVLSGEQLPFWDGAKRLAEDCLGAFPGLRFAGADIAFGVNGPVVIEMNPLPERNGACVFNVPTARVIPRRRG